jgi:hypothetical protein
MSERKRALKTAPLKPNPKYYKFLTEDEAQYIINAISRGYHDRDDYPSFEIVSFQDRPKFQRYVETVICEMVK